MTAAKSIVLVNTGDGKGKTSAAMGVMARSWARGWKVVVVQFIKGEGWKVGEQKVAEELGIEWHALGDGFTWESTDLDETAAIGAAAWQVAKEKLADGSYDMVILDEFTYAVTYGWVELDDVVESINGRSPTTNVVITGRNAHPAIIDLAHTVTEMRMVKHAYEQGIMARKGIEY